MPSHVYVLKLNQGSALKRILTLFGIEVPMGAEDVAQEQGTCLAFVMPTIQSPALLKKQKILNLHPTIS